MNKTIKELENERKKKIKTLSIDEIKNYIRNLHKMRFYHFENNNKELADYYSYKIKEIFLLTDDKFKNLDSYADNIEICILYSNLIIDSVEAKSFELLYKSKSLIHARMKLHDELEVLKSLINLNNGDLDEVINDLMISMINTIIIMQDDMDYLSEELLNNKLEYIEKEKRNILNNYHYDERLKQIKEDNYLYKLQGLSNAYNTYDEKCKLYHEKQNQVIDFIKSVKEFN